MPNTEVLIYFPDMDYISQNRIIGELLYKYSLPFLRTASKKEIVLLLNQLTVAADVLYRGPITQSYTDSYYQYTEQYVALNEEVPEALSHFSRVPTFYITLGHDLNNSYIHFHVQT